MAAEAAPLAPLLAALRDLATWCESFPVPYAIIGGVAASLLGRPRVTRDVDALVWVEEMRWEAFVAAAGSFGIVARVTELLAFASEARVLLLRHQSSDIEIDIALGALPFEQEVLARAKVVEVAGFRLLLPVPEDLIIMKAIAHRPRDLIDIDGLLATFPRLNRKRIRRWVQQFGEALETPEIIQDLENLLRQKRSRKKK